MQLKESIALIEYDFGSLSSHRVWADLGCGTGLFTLALASLLPQGSIIHAMDINKAAIDTIPNRFENVVIKKWHGDFMEDKLPDQLDGVLMANSLHFVKNKNSFLTKASASLKQEHCYLIVEYNSDKANHWVPFPLSFHSLKQLFQEAGYTSIKKLWERPSIYRDANIYSALIKKSLER
ncbi:MAG: methyltransferase type 11 [Candidatus Brocadia sp. WS118]|nr:MAG: methyltransferase type 11 [Candidatus Brocadia sp. WS118]